MRDSCPQGAWHTLPEQLGQAQAENKQIKQFVKKYVPFNKKNYQNQKQNAKQPKEAQQTDDDKNPKVNKIEIHNEPEEDEDYLLWNLMAHNEDVEIAEHGSDNDILSPQVNVILSGTRMTSEFPVETGAYATSYLYDSGASHSCKSYQCFKTAFPTAVPNEAKDLTV